MAAQQSPAVPTQDAIYQMVLTYSDALVRFAYGYVKNAAAAEDVAGDTVAHIFIKSKRFENQNLLRAYLYKVARSKAIDYLRRHKNEVPLEDWETGLTCESAENAALRNLRNEILHKCMNNLHNTYREALQLTYFEGFSLEETGRILGKNSKQMYNIHTRAKIALKNLLEKEGISCEDL